MEVPIEIKNIMGPKETIEMFVDAEAHPEITVDTVTITSERIILKRTQVGTATSNLMLIGFSDITAVGLEKGFMRSILRLRVKSHGGSVEAIRMPSKLADQASVILKQKVCGIVAPF
jgi:hypothetical protein